MSDEELVKRLREYCSIDKGADPIMLKVLSVVRPDLSDAAAALEAQAAEIARLRSVLSDYADSWCEGWCRDAPADALFEDCGGCLARAALEVKS